MWRLHASAVGKQKNCEPSEKLQPYRCDVSKGASSCEHTQDVSYYEIVGKYWRCDDDSNKFFAFINDKLRKKNILGTSLKNISRRDKKEIREHLSSRLVGTDRAALEPLAEKVDKNGTIKLHEDFELKQRFSKDHCIKDKLLFFGSSAKLNLIKRLSGNFAASKKNRCDNSVQLPPVPQSLCWVGIRSSWIEKV